ncbi:hypothetical protein GNZ12_12285 [Paraburkholderia sp. 1N]|uniref:Uncharacterized protein n=1 Tax=Paraburkholderia solitsugae TaxID=2675748 RepID=A0ABX2BQH1_9BURK|nr:hypothetical protein [Paraburkholderia solitsugae]NPT42083.1 hypothetical protein [Paraburkholderia solitsugae]
MTAPIDGHYLRIFYQAGVACAVLKRDDPIHRVVNHKRARQYAGGNPLDVERGASPDHPINCAVRCYFWVSDESSGIEELLFERG